MSDLVYLYGIVPHDAVAPSNLTGIGGRPVTLLAVGNVRAAISHVPADEFGAEPIETNLQDIGWVAEQGIAHENVVAWFVDHGEILPVPLFTLYSGDDSVRSTLSSQSAQLDSELARLAHKREWDLKIAIDPAEAERHAGALSPRIAELEREANEANPGKRYLLERKRNDLVKSETRNAARSLADDVLAAAKALSVEQRVLPIPQTTDDLPVILHAALLVEREREVELIGRLEATKHELAAKGLSVSFSGPWAPYRFTVSK